MTFNLFVAGAGLSLLCPIPGTVTPCGTNPTSHSDQEGQQPTQGSFLPQCTCRLGALGCCWRHGPVPLPADGPVTPRQRGHAGPTRAKPTLGAHTRHRTPTRSPPELGETPAGQERSVGDVSPPKRDPRDCPQRGCGTGPSPLGFGVVPAPSFPPPFPPGTRQLPAPLTPPHILGGQWTPHG